MISIGNYRVDNVNWFKEHEGYDAFQCNIFFNNENIGFFSESYTAGPDEYKFYDDSYRDNITKLRSVAFEFFRTFSKEDILFSDEDFFIRFLQKLNEAELESALDETIIIDTSYPFDYKIMSKKDSDLEPAIIDGEEKNSLRIPTTDFDINIDLLNMRVDYGL